MPPALKQGPLPSSDPIGRWTIVGLVLICAGSFFVRTWFLRDVVFTADGFVNYHDNDPWYHHRLLEHMVRNFPGRLGHDPYAQWPGGQTIGVGPFFDLSLAAIIHLLSLGNPSQRLIDGAAAFYPPTLAVLVCLVVYGLGCTLFHQRGSGLLAAVAIGFLPGAYFVRSCLGYFDHHIMEVLLSALVMALVIEALRRADLSGLTIMPPAGLFQRHIPWTLLAGITLGCYLLTWVGGNFLLVILYSWAVVQFARDQLTRHPTGYLFKVLAPCLAIAALIVLPYHDVFMARLQIMALVGGVIMVAVLSGLSTWVRKRSLSPIVFIGGALAFGIGGLLAIRTFDPTLLARIWAELGRLSPDPTARTITEARPLIFTNKGFSLLPVWEMFTTTLPIALVGLVALLVRSIRDRDPGRWLLFVWSVIVLAAILGQGRFSYYAAPVIALLVGYVICGATQFVLNLLTPAREAPAQSPSTRRTPQKAVVPTNRRARLVAGTACVVLTLIAFVPGMMRLPEAARFHDGPDKEWVESLRWLRTSTPAPFGSEDAYYARDEAIRDERSYSIMSWWDYGYWITAIARRPPMSNPTQSGAETAARFLLALDEDAASRIMDQAQARYVVLDWLLPRWQGPEQQQVRGKFSALPVWTGQSVKEFYERVLIVEEKNKLVSRYIYYPAYYRTMCVRLVIFSGVAVPPKRPVRVYTLETRRLPTGEARKVVTAVHEFDKYREALAFVAEAKDGQRVIASENPLITCVPLEPLERYKLVHQSPTRVARIMHQDVSPVRVFEYMPRTAVFPGKAGG